MRCVMETLKYFQPRGLFRVTSCCKINTYFLIFLIKFCLLVCVGYIVPPNLLNYNYLCIKFYLFLFCIYLLYLLFNVYIYLLFCIVVIYLLFYSFIYLFIAFIYCLFLFIVLYYYYYYSYI